MVVYAGGKNLSSLPFPAIVGQEELKRVLLVVAINDDLDGALIVGEKGTAKSTTVRALVDLLPEQRFIPDCPYGCPPEIPSVQCSTCRTRTDPPVETRPTPLVTLPLGATRDRVIGTLSVEDALDGEANFDPGLLARANRGILYVDEVNLLEDHLVDVLLDAAAHGINTVERDGVSVTHPANFTLIGTMNPEEGDIRPQLRDRFALHATVEGCRNIDERVDIIDRALDDGDRSATLPDIGSDDDNSSTTNTARWEEDDEYVDELATVTEQIRRGREILSRVELPSNLKARIATICLDAGVDGHRGDVATARTAMTLAALDDRLTVTESDVREAASYALPHRLKTKPFEEPPDLESVLDEHFEDESASNDADQSDGADDESGEHDHTDAESSTSNPTDTSQGDMGNDVDGSESGTSSGTNPSDTETATTSRSNADDPNAGNENEGIGAQTTETSEGGERPHSGVQSNSAATTDDRTGEPSTDEPNGGDGASRSPGPSRTDESEPETEHDTDTKPETGHDTDTKPETEPTTPLTPGRRIDTGSATGPTIDQSTGTADSDTDGSGATAPPASDNRGVRVRTERATEAGPIDTAASVRAAAVRGSTQVETQDLRRSVRTGEQSVTIVFAVDASASMKPAMRAAKGVVLDLLRQSYERRDEVAFVAFAGTDATVLLPPTNSVELAARHLKDLPSGDRTPLPAGLDAANRVIERADADAAVLVLVTDGKANTSSGSPTDDTRRAAREITQSDTDTNVLVVDAGSDSLASLATLVAEETDGEHIRLSSLTPESVRTAANHAHKQSND